MINRFLQGWSREGPGIPADLPPKTGLALLGSTIVREAWELFVLNLLIVLCCLPLVTIPAAHAAAARVSAKMLRDEPIYLLRDFRAAFSALFLRATLIGAGAGLVLLLCAYAVFIYGQLVLVSPLYAVPLVLAVSVSLGVLMTAMAAIVLMAAEEAPQPKLIRRAVTATLLRPLPALAALACVAALWLAHVMFYPVSVFMPAVANFSLGVLIVTFAMRPTVSGKGMPARPARATGAETA
jgi:uncharacterized membrane protein YesL